MRFGVGVRFPVPGQVALVSTVALRSRAGAVGGGKVSLAGRATTRQASRPGLGSVPVITSTSFSTATNPGFNAVIGTVLATNSPTSFAIISGNPSGFFAIASNGVLRTGAAAAPQDNTYSLTITATNSFGTSPPKTIAVTVGAVPVVNDQTFNLQLPTSNGAAVGDVAVSGGTPISFAITAGNASGFFAINSTGDITVTSAGASGITAQTYNLTVQATNALGSDTGVVSVIASSQAATIPMSFNDPIFTGMTETTNPVFLSNGQSFTRRSIIENSGNPTWICLGNNTLNFCRSSSREGIRVTDGNVTVESCFLETKGIGDDHADTIQAYSPGASGGTITLRNTHVKGFYPETGGFIASVGYFTADSWSGTIVIDNCIFNSGAFGLRTISDPNCTIDLYMNNVFFVGPFGNGNTAILLQRIGSGASQGVLTVRQWNNVRNATISGGVLVPGSIINNPG